MVFAREIRLDDVADLLVRGLMKKHEDHVHVLEALIYNQETLVHLKDAKIEELEEGKQQLQYHVAKMEHSQHFFEVITYWFSVIYVDAHNFLDVGDGVVYGC